MRGGSVSDNGNRWDLDDAALDDALNIWEIQDQPPVELRDRVTAWIRTILVLDPYKNAQPEFEEFFFQAVPGCIYGGRLVVCSYFAYSKVGTTGTIKINHIALLEPPIGASTQLIWPEDDGG
jgi:hypothetical protein